MILFKNGFKVALIVTLFTALLTGCAMSDISENETEVDFTSVSNEVDTNTAQSSPKTISLVTLQYPPYEYDDNGVVKGIAVDIVKEGFKRIGYEVNVTIYPWARALEIIKNGEADGIFTAYKTPERETFAEYSKEILMPQTVSLFVLKDSGIKFERDLIEMSKYTFGTVREVSYGEKFDALVKDGKLTVEETNNGEENMLKLLNGRVDILVSNRYGALWILRRSGEIDAVKELTPVIQSVPSYIAFSKARKLSDLRDEFDEILLEMKKDGTIDKITKNYIGVSETK